MKILLDESLPKRLKDEFTGHVAITVPEQGWAGKKNGELLQLASNAFDVFLTADQNLEYQQNLANHDIGVIILAGPTNRFDDLRMLVPAVLMALKTIQAGQVVRVAV